jgi:hypothetical protein
MERKGGAFKDYVTLGPVDDQNSRTKAASREPIELMLRIVQPSGQPHCRKVRRLSKIAYDLFILLQKHTFVACKE